MRVGSLIKYYRLKRGMKQIELARGICSISHLSKIENNSYNGNEETINLLIKKLGISLEEKNNHHERFIEVLENFFLANLHCNDKLIEQIYKEFLSYENYANLTTLINTYHLYHYKYYIYKKDMEKISSMESFLLKFKNSFSASEKNLYKILTGNALLLKNNPFKAKNTLLSLMSNLKTDVNVVNSELYYLIGLSYSHLREYEKAIFYSKKALDFFQRENNFIRILHTQIVLSINYVRIGLLEEAKSNYQSVIQNAQLLNQHDLYNQTIFNLGLLYKKKKEYRKALELFIESEQKFDTNSIPYIICKLGIIELLFHFEADEEEIIKHIDTALAVSEKNNQQKYYLQAKSYKKKLFSQVEFYSFIENILYPYYKKNNFSKEAQDLAKELIDYYSSNGNNFKKASYY
ncbi:helix-turn-helix domain-containing protein [Paucisalibacillus globulus]|uniref:helix-turn-helix domain-containing protein n=1 Tax=Paucisalibacillus globulus TaxID=351095 RepID=UPI000BB980C9|nr:helix-turn-helix domain-containing protein [Paucisalibacillus globulus]